MAPKVKRGSISFEIFAKAAEEMKKSGLSSREAAKAFGIPSHITLFRFCKQIETGTASVGFKPACRVFSIEQ